MKRFVVLALAALLGCNAILGIESASVDPMLDAGVDAKVAEPELDAGNRRDAARVDAATPDPERPEAGSCVDTDRNPRHCGTCNHDCGPGTCVDATCQPGIVASGFTGSGGALLVTSTHVYHADFDHGVLTRTPIYGGTPAVMFDSGGSPSGFDSPLGHNLVAIGDYIYFGDRPRNRVARCPLLGACEPETIIADFPRSYSLATANGDLYAADGVRGTTIVLCAAPPCAEKKVVVSGEEGILLMAASNTDLAWSTIAASGKGSIKTRPIAATTQQTLLDQPAGLIGATSLVVTGRDVHAVFLSELLRWRLPSTTKESLGKIGATESLRYDGLSYWYGDYSTGAVYQRASGADPDAGSDIAAQAEGAVMDVAIHPTGIYWSTETTIWRRVR